MRGRSVAVSSGSRSCKAKLLALAFVGVCSASCFTRFAVNEHQPWRYTLEETDTPRLVIERCLEQIQVAAAEYRADWKPIISGATQSVEISFEVPIDPAKPNDRRVYEASIRLVVDDITNGVITITPLTVVSVSTMRDGVIWNADDSEERDLTHEIQMLLHRTQKQLSQETRP